jgi:hypothetical protein
MKVPDKNFEELKRDKELLGDFEPSIRGFMLNVSSSYFSGIISEEQKNELLKDIKNKLGK